MAEPLLSISGLTAGYGDVQVLWGIDMTVEEGQMVCLVGSNGAGKTTLLRTISGLVRATSGRVAFAGRDLTGTGTDVVLGAGIAHVPEGRRLFKGLSVRDNMLLGAYLRRDSHAVADDLERVFDIFPILRERQAQDATTLSGGEQQMCAIARGLMGRPQLLMIDELSLGLAPKAVELLSEALVRVAQGGPAILLVEQDVVAALELASRAFVVDRGRVVLSGPSASVAADPKVREAYLGVV